MPSKKNGVPDYDGVHENTSDVAYSICTTTCWFGGLDRRGYGHAPGYRVGDCDTCWDKERGTKRERFRDLVRVVTVMR